MTVVKKSVQRLAPKVPRLPGVPVPKVPGSRRGGYAAGTREALVDAADALFADQGYASTSLDSVVAGAEVTKGALYHHFTGKQALFEAVFERVEEGASAEITAAMTDEDPWTRAQQGLRAFLEVVRDPRYRRVVIQDGPAVLGYERFRESEERSSFADVLEIVGSLLEASAWEVDEQTRRTFARIFFGALSSAGEGVATAEDAAGAAARAEAVIGFMLAGFRVLVEQGHGAPDVLGLRALDPQASPGD